MFKLSTSDEEAFLMSMPFVHLCTSLSCSVLGCHERAFDVFVHIFVISETVSAAQA